MSFGDVDNQKPDFSLVLIVKFVEGRNLPPEWRSSVAAKNHHYGLSFVQLRQPDGSRFVQFCERKVWGGVAHMNCARAGSCPQRFKRDDQEDFPRHVGHYASKIFRRTVHCPPQESNKPSPEHEQADENRGRDPLPTAAWSNRDGSSVWHHVHRQSLIRNPNECSRATRSDQ